MASRKEVDCVLFYRIDVVSESNVLRGDVDEKPSSQVCFCGLRARYLWTGLFLYAIALICGWTAKTNDISHSFLRPKIAYRIYNIRKQYGYHHYSVPFFEKKSS